MREACEAARPYLGEPLIVSVAAGIRTADIARWLGRSAIVRTMPNTPALIGRGVTGMAATAQVGGEQRALAESILRTAGDVVWFDDEAKLDAVTAVSGSGPAYVFYFIEALARAGAELGFTAEQARELAVADLRRRGAAGGGVGRAAGDAASPRHLEGRHHRRRARLAGSERRGGADRRGGARRAPARPRTRRRIRPPVAALPA